jgi:muramoyltetrapeptide carboxypeptidase
MIDGRLAKGSAGYDATSFLSLIQGLGAGLDLQPDGLSPLKPGEADGLLFGGTLTQLTASLATPYAFDPPDGCILFMEDVNERPYRIDRMLTQLRLAGVLRKASGLVFGEMRGCDEPNGALTARDAIRSFTADFPGPVLFGFPSGHTSGPCWTLPLGVRVSMKTIGAALRIEESPVA